MSFAKVYSAQANLIGATIITVEADLSRGLHSFSIVGLPDKAIEEAKDRISAAIKNSGFPSPKSKNHKITLSLAPADLRKVGPLFDVPMALAYLLAAGEFTFDPQKRLFLGELSLDGKVRPVPGVLPLAREAEKQGFTELFVPYENAEEACLIPTISIYGVKDFREIVQHFKGEKLPIYTSPHKLPALISDTIDISEIKGQEHAKRALEIAAAGGHNCALHGPPGTGKTMLAQAFSGLLPDLTTDQYLDVASIYSVSGLLHNIHSKRPPFRSPHHTSSYSAIIGGGPYIKPGELTLAHQGVLFLDEFPEFDRRVIDSLRQPLEQHSITISRQKSSQTFPAHCILLIAFNPCPCGNYSSPEKLCTCTPTAVSRYLKKISGPIIDRIDLWSNVHEVKRELLTSSSHSTETTTVIRRRIEQARIIQRDRFQNHNSHIVLNSDMSGKDIIEYCNLTGEAEKILIRSSETLKLSSRTHHKIVKIAQTIADLGQKEKIDTESILEALQYRPHLL